MIYQKKFSPAILFLVLPFLANFALATPSGTKYFCSDIVQVAVSEWSNGGAQYPRFLWTQKYLAASPWGSFIREVAQKANLDLNEVPKNVTAEAQLRFAVLNSLVGADLRIDETFSHKSPSSSVREFIYGIYKNSILRFSQESSDERTLVWEFTGYNKSFPRPPGQNYSNFQSLYVDSFEVEKMRVQFHPRAGIQIYLGISGESAGLIKERMKNNPNEFSPFLSKVFKNGRMNFDPLMVRTEGHVVFTINLKPNDLPRFLTDLHNAGGKIIIEN